MIDYNCVTMPYLLKYFKEKKNMLYFLRLFIYEINKILNMT